MTRKRPFQKDTEARPSLVGPSVAALLSLIVPGLGQLLAGAIRRGLLLFFSLGSSVGLLAWRIRLAARREEEVVKIFLKAISLQPFLAVLVALVVALWLWTAWDARRQARAGQAGGAGIFVLVLVIFFALGWQITEIDLYKAVTQINEAGPPLLKILWPWEKAITQEKSYTTARVDIATPCTDNPPALPGEVPGQPYVMVEPTCGIPSESGKPGSVLTVSGRGFPDSDGLLVGRPTGRRVPHLERRGISPGTD